MTHDLRPSVIAEKYLTELERAAVALPANRRAELLADVRSHIEVARTEARADSIADADDDAVVRTILSQLGDPREIVAAAVSDLPEQTGSAAREVFTLILLLVGGLLFWLVPVVSWIGWLIGLILLGLSGRWSAGDKLIGVAGVTLAPLALTGSMMLAGGTESCAATSMPAPDTQAQAAAAQSAAECSTSGLVLPPALAVCLLIGLLAITIFAMVRLARRIRPA
ncbi:HAAS signaling domain-containing protein [Streptomyces wedmorensis]